MPTNRIIKKAIYDSDKLAACSDAAKLHYNHLLPLQDNFGCWEINVRLIRKNCYGHFQQPPAEEEILGWIQEWNHSGLLFVWQAEGGKLWGYITGEEKGRLPEPSRRGERKSPVFQREQLLHYQQSHKELQPASSGFKVVQAASASPQPPSTTNERPPPALNPPQPASSRLNVPQAPSLARAGAELELESELEPEKSTVHNSARSQEPRTVHSSSVKKTLGDLGKNMEASAEKNGDLRKQLEKGIHRNRLFANYDDLFSAAKKKRKNPQTFLSDFEDLMQKWVDDCVNLLLSERGAVELKGIVPHFLVNKAREKIEPSLQIMFGVKDYDKRKRQAGGRLINCVVDAALELRK